jgi:site-specific DNA recombinase
VEEEPTDLDDVLKDRLDALTAERDRARAFLECAKARAGGTVTIDRSLIEQGGRTMRGNLTSGSIPLRKAYIHSIVDAVEIDDGRSASRAEGRA